MKIWTAYGSEHSADINIIGTFKSAYDAQEVKNILDQIITQAKCDGAEDMNSRLPEDRRFSKEMTKLLDEYKIYIKVEELEELAFSPHISCTDKTISIHLQEENFSGFVRLLIEKEAKVEIYLGR